MRNRAFAYVLLLGFCSGAQAQSSSSQEASVAEETPPRAQRSVDPYQAYTDGRFAEAFEGFANLQVKRPKDVDLMLNLGASLYRLKDFAGAEKAWSLAAEHGDPNIRAQALYDMGNSAFQQKHLKEAVQHFEGALSLNPNDEDARHNLRVTKKRLEAEQQEQQKNQDPNAPKDPQDPNQTGDKTSQDPNGQKDPSSKDGDKSESNDPDGPGEHSDHHDKQEPKGEGQEPQPKDAKEDAETSPEQAKDGEQDSAQKTKHMPRSQAERMLDAMGESRPRHAPSGDKAGQRPPDGMDW